MWPRSARRVRRAAAYGCDRERGDHRGDDHRGILGTVVTVLVGPTVVRRVGSTVTAGAGWVTTAARRAGVPGGLIDEITTDVAKRVAEAGRSNNEPTT